MVTKLHKYRGWIPRLIGALLLMGWAVGMPSSKSAPDAGVYAFTGAHVIPMDTERILNDHTVLIEHGYITALGPDGTVEIPDEAIRIPTDGKFLIPGLMDMHAHLLSDDRIADRYAPHEFAVMVANGVTTIRNPIGKSAHLTYRTQIQQNKILGPNFYPCSPQFTVRPFGRVFNGVVATSPEVAADYVREFKAAGYDCIKLTFGLSRAVYDAIIAAADAADIRVIGHVDPLVGLARAFETGLQIEHLDQYLEALLPEDAPVPGSLSGSGIWRRTHWPSLDYLQADLIPELARETVAANVWNTPTLTFLNVAFGSGRSEEEIRQTPDYQYVSPEVRDDLLIGYHRFWGNPPDADHRARYVALRQEITKAIYEAGGKLMTGSDAPEWLFLYGFTLHRELEQLVLAGLTPYAALEAATKNPAQFLGADHLGTIAPGKQADLVLLDGNPLADITQTQANAGVMIRGQWLPPQEIERMLNTARAALSTAPLRAE